MYYCIVHLSSTGLTCKYKLYTFAICVRWMMYYCREHFRSTELICKCKLCTCLCQGTCIHSCILYIDVEYVYTQCWNIRKSFISHVIMFFLFCCCCCCNVNVVVDWLAIKKVQQNLMCIVFYSSHWTTSGQP